MTDEKPEEAPAETKMTLVSDEELLEAFAGPAVHSNKMYLTIASAGIRLSFMEQLGEKVPPQFRTAVNMSFEDALSLKNLLERQLKRFQPLLEIAERMKQEAKRAAAEEEDGKKA